ncbi:MAG: hypothetical protein WB791_08335 [Waddliaceae bacterium]
MEKIRGSVKQKIPKRVAIIGPPGSGKSTFAIKLGNLLNIAVHHLDVHMFIGDIKRDKQEFLEIQRKIIAEDSWIIEGCSISTLEMRFARADTVLYLDFLPLLCIWRVCKRALFHHEDLAGSGCAKVVNRELLKYIWTFKREKGAAVNELKRRYPGLNLKAFSSTKDFQNYLEEAAGFKE